jgi:hypothetical protein
VHAFGRTVRRYGDLWLVAVPAAGGAGRDVVAQDGEPPLGAFPTLRAAVACFEALRAAAVARAEAALADEAPGDLLPGPPGPPVPGDLIDLAEYRRTRRR